MWVTEYTGTSTANPDEVFAVLAEPRRWSEWNEGVQRIEMDGPFAEGTSARMVLPDGTVLPFRFTWVAAGRGYADLTEVPGTDVVVRVRHDLTPAGTGTRITYRCEADGPADLAAEIGAGASEDFPAVIAALAARAERGVETHPAAPATHA